MVDENENTTFSADRVIAELIADVEQRWQQMDTYKRSVGTGIPFSQASDRWQNYIRDKISQGISQGKGISFDEARSRFENFIREGAVVDHITENPSEDGNRLFALQSQMRSEKDATRKSELQQQYNNLSKEIFAKLPEAEKTRLTDRFINDRIVPKHANLKAQAEINAPKGGYCLKGITASLYKINDKYGLGLLPENTPENQMPGAFMQGLRNKNENAGKHIFHTNENQTFGQIVEREGIRPGAIVILDDSKGNPHHAMFWTGKRDENGEPQLIGFNGMGAEEESNVALSYAKNGKARIGTIIDISGMVADSMEKEKESQNLRNVCRDVYHQCVDGLLSEDDISSLENLFMQSSGTYKFFEPQEFTSTRNLGRNVERLQNIIGNLCQGNNPTNRQIKDFMLKKGYINENSGQIEFSPTFALQTPDNGLIGGCTKSDKNNNILIVINQRSAERSDNSLAVIIGHEICHLMINDKLPNSATSAEVEALCDLVGLTAAKGAGYDISNKVAENEKDFSRKVQKEAYLQYFAGQPDEFIEKMVDEHMKNTVNSLYMPEKLNQIVQFIDAKVPKRTDQLAKITEVRGKLATLRGNREQAENPSAEKTATAVKQREPQGQDRLNAALLNRMRGQKMDGKP